MSDEVKPVLDNIMEKETPHRLVGGHCLTCSKYYFPTPPVCPSCLGQLERATLADDGILYSYTVVRIRAPLGLPQPYAVGYVDIPANNLRIFSLLDSDRIDRLAVGVPVSLRVSSLGTNTKGEPCLRYFFTPK
jgi:uncharacterized OB-fold protein